MEHKKRLILLTLTVYTLSAYMLFAKPMVKWYDFNTGIKLAKKHKVPVVIDFFDQSCHWCMVMDRETFSDRAVITKMDKYYIPIRINMSSRDKIIYKGITFSSKEFASILGIEGLPTTVFMDKEGVLISKIPGYIKRNKYLSLLSYFKDECYKKEISFNDYMNGKTDCR
jgi:thioredoxin-related protein